MGKQHGSKLRAVGPDEFQEIETPGNDENRRPLDAKKNDNIEIPSSRVLNPQNLASPAVGADDQLRLEDSQVMIMTTEMTPIEPLSPTASFEGVDDDIRSTIYIPNDSSVSEESIDEPLVQEDSMNEESELPQEAEAEEVEAQGVPRAEPGGENTAPDKATDEAVSNEVGNGVTRRRHDDGIDPSNITENPRIRKKTEKADRDDKENTRHQRRFEPRAASICRWCQI